MSLKFRRFLFYGFLVLFAVGGCLIVLYSQGWRIIPGRCENITFPNQSIWEKTTEFLNCELRFKTTGAIYVETKPQGVDMKIDGKKFDDKSGLLQSGTLITDLLPKSYKVEITKDGYYSWTKNLEVKPQLVAEAQDIVLIQKDYSPEQVSDTQMRGNTLTALNSTSHRVLLKDSKLGIFYLWDPASPTVFSNINLSFKNLSQDKNIYNVAFHPFDSNKLLIETKNGLYIMDTLRSTLETISTVQPVAWTTLNNGVYLLVPNPSASSSAKQSKKITLDLDYFNLVLKTKSLIYEITDSNLLTSTIRKFDISRSETWIAILNKNGNLYLYNTGTQNFKEIAYKVKDFDFSSDSRKIAYLDNDQKLNILFLDDWNRDNHKKAGDSMQFKLGTEPLSISWYKNNYHLLVNYPDEIKIMEIDDRLPNNSYSLLKGAQNNFYYDVSSNFIYFLKDKYLYRFLIQ